MGSLERVHTIDFSFEDVTDTLQLGIQRRAAAFLNLSSMESELPEDLILRPLVFHRNIRFIDIMSRFEDVFTSFIHNGPHQFASEEELQDATSELENIIKNTWKRVSSGSLKADWEKRKLAEEKAAGLFDK